MKKLLALVLALVMTLGLATVGANAALDDFTDGKDVNYTEAMSVMNAVGVFQGSDGKLTPKDNLTRAQAAKIIAYLNLGETAAEALTKDVTAFSDVPAGGWATGYITYCYNSGIVGGKGNNQYDPDANVTALEFAKMLLVTLGYEPAREGLVGETYALNTAKLAAKAGLFDDNEGVSVNQPATREEAALYAFNALKAECVEYATASTVVEGADGMKVTVGGSNATPVTTGANRAAITAEAGTNVMQLGEKLYKGDLKLNNLAAADYMGRPADVWTWKSGANSEIGRFEKEADYTAVVKKTGKTFDDIIDDISKSIRTDTPAAAGTPNAIVTINGAPAVAATAAAGAANAPKLGDYLEIYMDENNPGYAATVAVTRLDGAAKLTGDLATRANGGVEQIRLPGAINSWTDASKVSGYAGLVKDDIVYWYIDNDTNYHVFKAESFDGQLNAVKTGTPNKYTINGTDYLANTTTAGATGIAAIADVETTAVYNTDYRYYTDSNGLLIYAKKLGETSKDYVMIQQLAYVPAGSAIGSTGRVEARIVKMDGTVDVVKVASIDMKTAAGAATIYGGIYPAGASETATAVGFTHPTGTDKWLVFNNALNNNCDDEPVGTMLFTYKTNSDGEYEFTNADQISGVTSGSLTGVGAASTDYKASAGVLPKGVGGAIAVDDDTIFVVRNNMTSSSPKFTVYTGKNNAPVISSGAGGSDISFAYTAEKDVATCVVVYSYGTKSTAGDWVYVLSGTVATTQFKDADGNSYNYNVVKALKSGESNVIDLMTSYSFTNADIGLYNSLTYHSTTGALTGATKAGNQEGITAGYRLSGSTLSTNKTFAANTYANAYDCPSDAILVYKDTDDVFTVGTTGDIGTDANDLIYVARTNGADNKVKIAYIVEKDNDATGLAAVQTQTTATPPVFEKAATASASTTHATLTGVSGGIDYVTYTFAGTVTTGNNLVIVGAQGCRISYFDNGVTDPTTAWGTVTWTASPSNAAVINLTGTAAHNIMVRVTAEDEATSAYYLIQVTDA